MVAFCLESLDLSESSPYPYIMSVNGLELEVCLCTPSLCLQYVFSTDFLRLCIFCAAR